MISSLWTGQSVSATAPGLSYTLAGETPRGIAKDKRLVGGKAAGHRLCLLVPHVRSRSPAFCQAAARSNSNDPLFERRCRW